jgi:hypothetical protein
MMTESKLETARVAVGRELFDLAQQAWESIDLDERGSTTAVVVLTLMVDHWLDLMTADGSDRDQWLNGFFASLKSLHEQDLNIMELVTKKARGTA